MRCLSYLDDNLSVCGNGYCALPQWENCGANNGDCWAHVKCSKASAITDEHLLDQVDNFLTVTAFEKYTRNVSSSDDGDNDEDDETTEEGEEFNV